MSWRRGQTSIWSKFFFDHSSTSSSSWLGLLNRGSLRAQALSLELVLTPLAPWSNWLKPSVPGLYYCLTSAVLPLIYTGASLDWRLGRGSIYKNLFPLHSNVKRFYLTHRYDPGGATIPSQSGPGSNGNEKVLHILQSSTYWSVVIR